MSSGEIPMESAPVRGAEPGRLDLRRMQGRASQAGTGGGWWSARTYPPDVNGAARFTAQLAAGLADRGHQVHVVCPAAGTGVGGHRPGPPRGRGAPAAGATGDQAPDGALCPPPLTGPALRRVLDSVAPDIVHIHSHLLIGRALSALAHDRAIPLVATHHTLPENLVGHLPVPAATHRWVIRAAWARACAC